jgi:hypothetical protein
MGYSGRREKAICTYFATTFFHDELRTAVEEASLSIEKLAAIEGPVMWMKSFDADWHDTRR